MEQGTKIATMAIKLLIRSFGVEFTDYSAIDISPDVLWEKFVMKTIYLISCVSKKLSHKAKARDLYQSDLFKKSLHYAENKNPDAIYILSAKYGLVPLEKEIEPYDKTVSKMSAEENRRWAKSVIEVLQKVADLENDEFVFLAGNDYRKNLMSEIKKHEIPMEGLPIGKQLNWLNEHLK